MGQSIRSLEADVETVVTGRAGGGLARGSASQVQARQQPSSSSSGHQPPRLYLEPEAGAIRSGKPIHPTSSKRSYSFKASH